MLGVRGIKVHPLAERRTFGEAVARTGTGAGTVFDFGAAGLVLAAGAGGGAGSGATGSGQGSVCSKMLPSASWQK